MIQKFEEEKAQAAAKAAAEEVPAGQEAVVEEEAETQETDGKTPEERKREKRIQHLALMERLKGTRQSYEPRGKWKHKSSPAAAPAPTSSDDPTLAPALSTKSSKAERHAKHLALMESLKGTKQEYPSRGKSINKAERHAQHLALMESLKGTKQEHPSRGADNGAATEGEGAAETEGQVVEAKQRDPNAKLTRAERHARHLALMESLKGTKQEYPSRGKWKKGEKKVEAVG
ncbi:hypothetical protein ACMFMG_010159 [Clarireedia jacksonii]